MKRLWKNWFPFLSFFVSCRNLIVKRLNFQITPIYDITAIEKIAGNAGTPRRWPLYSSSLKSREENDWIHTFPLGISVLWNAKSLIKDLNSSRRAHFLRQYPLHHKNLHEWYVILISRKIFLVFFLQPTNINRDFCEMEWGLSGSCIHGRIVLKFLVRHEYPYSHVQRLLS